MSWPELQQPTTTAFLPLALGAGSVNPDEWTKRSPLKVLRPVMLVGIYGSPEWPVASTMWWG